MKANDLMIGDWVRIKDGYPFKMEDVSGTSMFRRWTSDGETMIPYGWNEIEPIPLTAEILEKNGFVHRQTEQWGDFFTYKWFIEQQDKTLQYDLYFHLSADPYEGSGFYWIPEMSAVAALHIRYVHELQHLMRLVGIEKEMTL